MGKLMNRRDYLSNLSLINEEAPFGNDIPWGDSLLGRLINSISRNAKISFNKKRIDSLAKRMKSIFDDMIEFGKVDISNEDKSFLQVSSALAALKKSVYDKEDINIIIALTENLINFVNGAKFDKKELMLKALNDFLDFLKGISSTDDDNVESEDKSDSELIKSEKNYNKLLLQSVIDIHNDIKQNVVRNKTGSENVITHFDEEKYKKQRSNTKEEISKKIEMIENAIKIYQNSKNKERVNFYWNERLKYENKLKSLNKRPEKIDTHNNEYEQEDDLNIKKDKTPERVYHESLINEGEANLHNIEQHAKNAWNKLVISYNKSGIAKYIKFLEELLSTDLSFGKEKYKRANDKIEKICQQVVLNVDSIGKPIDFKTLISESTSDINLSDVSKSISLFGRSILAFSDDIGLLDAYGSSNKHVKSFISSFNSLKKNTIHNESILSYLMFVEGQTHNNDEIKDKFDELFTEEVTSYFNISDKKKSELESSIKNRKEFLFTSADSIIEIVRLFNRAWRLHTPGVIPSGRSGGKVSNSVFREYEYLGEGSGGTPDSPGSGPYRNIKLYEAWGESVQDILSDTKYRELFSEHAIFKFKNEETGGEGDNIKKGGKILLRFINRLLADTEMYSTKGAMPKFIKEYFNLGSEDLEKIGGTAYRDFPDDERKNNKVASKIDVTDVKFKKVDRKISDDDIKNENILFRSSFLSSKSKNGRDYFRIHSIEQDKYIYFLYTVDGIPYDVSKVKFTTQRPSFRSLPVWVCKARYHDFINIPVDKKIEFSYINLWKQNASKEIKKITVSDFSVLVEDGLDDYFTGLDKFIPAVKNRISEDIINKTIAKLK